ncbi:hypothetical protein ACERII_01455 [Evansella sp. AB-rgal1]|uniref:hypothetical protein n=1 Tax=Evansella sp. AB-rgal1 TaxID=3242696 RepID=UPI00359EBADA
MKHILVLVVCIFLFSACYSDKEGESSLEQMPEDFNFSLIYGTYGKQKIDTFHDLVVKDLVEDGTVEVTLQLTDQEMNDIYKKMLELNIMSEELDLNEENECESDPPSISVWEIEMNTNKKTINYGTYCDYHQDVLNLMKLEDYIHEIVSNKEKYKSLPDSNGYYE